MNIVPSHTHPQLQKIMIASLVITSVTAIFTAYCMWHSLQLDKAKLSKIKNGEGI